MLRTLRAALIALTLPLAGCSSAHQTAAGDVSPPMRWDFRPEAPAWTAATLAALRGHGSALEQVVPGDIDTFCPAYSEGGPATRRAFWAGLFSALAKHESDWNPRAAGGGGRWIGLMQISPDTARRYGCVATSSADLKNGSLNLACAVRIAAAQVARDRMVAGNGRQGVGRDWAPIQSASRRADIAAWTRQQSYCQN